MSWSNKVVYDKYKKDYSIAAKIGSGGEGDVYTLKEKEQVKLVAKIYHDTIQEIKLQKLKAMIDSYDSKLDQISAWPQSILFDKSGKPVGFLMNVITGFIPIHELFNPSSRKRNFPNADWTFLVHATRNLAIAVNTIHEHGCIIGDINEGNILISDESTIKFIDCDSFQIKSKLTNQLFRCEVGVPLYTPPELQNQKNYRDVERTYNHDIFGMAVIAFQIIFMGRHPFIGKYIGPDIPFEKAIENYMYAYSKSTSPNKIQPPPASLSINSIHKELQLLFEKAFTEQGKHSRPNIISWIKEFDFLRNHIKVCSKEKTHKFYISLENCPWCTLEDKHNVYFFLANNTSDFNKSKFDLNKIWAQITRLSIPYDKIIIDPTVLIVSRKFKLFKYLHYFQKWLSIILFCVAVYFYPIAFLFAWIPALILFYYEGFGQKITNEKQKLNYNYERMRVKWEEANKKWTKFASDFLFKQKMMELHKAKVEYQKLPSDYEIDKKLLYSNTESFQLNAYLTYFYIKNYDIQDIGPTRKATLASWGIYTAADVNSNVLLNIQGFGIHLVGHLVSWRNKMATGFKFDSNKGIDKEEINKLIHRFNFKKIKLENTLKSGFEELNIIKIQILKYRTHNKANIEIIANEYQKAKNEYEHFLKL